MCLKFMPSGLTQKWSVSSGSRAVMWPAVPSSKPKAPKIRKAAARRCLRCRRSSSTLANFGNLCGLRSLPMGAAYLRLYRSVQYDRRMDFSLTEAERDLVGLCRDFAQKEIATRAPVAWEEARCPTDLLREMGELGLLGMLVPEEWGGIGMSTVGFVAAMEQIGLADQSVAAAWQAHVTIGSLPLYLFGTDAQRERWLRPLAEGRVLGAFGLTEPDAGSDARGISTRAEPKDGGWLVNGRKTFISNAGTDMSFGVTLLARTPSGSGGPALRQLRRREGHARLHHGPEDAGHRLEGPRHA